METHFPEEAFDKSDAVKELAEALYNKHREIIMDEMPDVQMTLGGMDTFVSDPRGRMIYLRTKQDL